MWTCTVSLSQLLDPVTIKSVHGWKIKKYSINRRWWIRSNRPEKTQCTQTNLWCLSIYDALSGESGAHFNQRLHILHTSSSFIGLQLSHPYREQNIPLNMETSDVGWNAWTKPDDVFVSIFTVSRRRPISWTASDMLYFCVLFTDSRWPLSLFPVSCLMRHNSLSYCWLLSEDGNENPAGCVW